MTYLPGRHPIPVVGLRYHEQAVCDTIAAVASGDETDALLHPETSNARDANSVAVYMSGGKVGYLRRDIAAVLQPALIKLSASHGGRLAGCPAVVSEASGKPVIKLRTDLRKMGIAPAVLFYD